MSVSCCLQGSWIKEGVALGTPAVLNTPTQPEESPNRRRVTWCYTRPTAQAGAFAEKLVHD